MIVVHFPSDVLPPLLLVIVTMDLTFVLVGLAPELTEASQL